VFTLPAAVADIATNKRDLDLLFKVSAETMLTIGPIRSTWPRTHDISVHTWLGAHHNDVHMIVPAAASFADGSRCVLPAGFFLSVGVYSPAAFAGVPGEARSRSPNSFILRQSAPLAHRRLRTYLAAAKTEWLSIKRPFGGRRPCWLLAPTPTVAISNSA